VESGDLEAVKGVFSPAFILHHTTGQDWSLEKTIETVKKQNEQSKSMIPDVTFIHEDTIANGDEAVLMFTFKGTHQAQRSSPYAIKSIADFRAGLPWCLK